MSQMNSMKKKQLGQGMTEYIIIVALVAVAAIGAYSYFGQTVRHQVAGLANEISGVSAAGSVKKAQGAAKKVDTKVDADMGTYGKAGGG